jgi:hypothetical protein
MQAAIDHLEAHKVFDEKLNTYVVPLDQAYAAIELSIDQQLADVLSTIESSLGEIGTSMNEIQDDIEDDKNRP